MKNYLKVDFAARQLVMDRTFAKNSAIVGSEEYQRLQTARRDYPSFTVVQRTIKRNPAKETYAGLTYTYMRDYILTHETKETAKGVIAEFEEMLLISKCHSKAFRYPAIKSWFLTKYPAIEMFGVAQGEDEEPEKIQQNEETETLPAIKAAA